MSKAIENEKQENTIFTVPVSKLVKSALNARKTVAKGADEELKASILAHGLQQNLVVMEGQKGKYEVVAGARRMEALKALIAEGKLPADHEALCQLVSAEDAFEVSLAENAVRMAMHPADEFAAYVTLINSGQTVEAVAQRFGKTARYVEQRLRLGRAAPELIQAYKAGEITLEVLEAYCVTDDRRKQLAVYEALNGHWGDDDPRHIRRTLTEQLVSAKSKLAVFVGQEAYEQAGGKVRKDLFGEEVFLENPELVNAMAEEKLKLVQKDLEAEGWQWVRPCAEITFTHCPWQCRWDLR